MPLSQTLAALADPNRQKIIDLLKKGERAVADLGHYLNITPPTLSHHLDILKRADLISARRQGQQIFYSLNLSVLEELVEKFSKFLNTSKK
ncbi:metalloregulator ArsR/SmtB family transcription factor [Patescibacteria group bacterium]|nr:metalloregulator ArsR/SmtB family transcription factor [Patescibacteria group bacterium]